jgi:hypothetical protein
MKQVYILVTVLALALTGTAQNMNRQYYPSGKLKYEGEMRGDTAVGTHTSFFENGNIHTETRYSAKGGIITTKEFDLYGNLILFKNHAGKEMKFPKPDFSAIQWQLVEDGVWIHYFNHCDTAVTVKENSVITAYYICYIADGTLVDNSYTRNEPLQAELSLFVTGFIAGLKAMRPGETVLIKMLPEKAYPDDPEQPLVSNKTLVYYVKLIGVK